MVSSTNQEKRFSHAIVRIFAVLALALAAAGVVLVISKSTTGSSGTTAKTHSTKTQANANPKDPCYVVKSGDTFAGIAAQEHVSQQRLRQLNPNLDPFSLQPLNAVNVVPDGCHKHPPGG